VPFKGALTLNVLIEEFRPLERNTLRGFARVRLPAGLILHDVAVHIHDGKPWASPPGRPMIGRDGTQMRDAAGKMQFNPVLTFAGRADQDAFSAAVIEAMRAAHPGVMA
jgi:hypothetical protein